MHYSFESEDLSLDSSNFESSIEEVDPNEQISTLTYERYNFNNRDNSLINDDSDSFYINSRITHPQYNYRPSFTKFSNKMSAPINKRPSSNEELKRKQNILEIKLNELDKRHIAALKILAEPVDDLRTNEILVFNAEKSLQLYQQRLSNSSSCLSIKSDIEEVKQLEQANFLRQKKLEKKQKTILQLQKTILMPKTPQNLSRKKGIIPKSTNPKQHSFYSISELADKSLIDKTYSDLELRAKDINEENCKLDQLEIEILQKSQNQELSWNKKFQYIEEITLKIHENEELKQKISQTSEDIIFLEDRTHQLNRSILTIKRKIENFYRDSNYHNQIISENEVLNKRIQEKQKQIELKQETINELKTKFEIQNQALIEKEQEINIYEQKIQKIEMDTKNKENIFAEEIKKIEEETKQISQSIANLQPYESQSSFEDQLRKSLFEN